MASTMNQQFKITKLAKDLGMKSKDLVELLAQNGIEAKTTQKALEPLEFDILFESLTQANQINDIGSYLDGVTYIPSKPKKAEKAEKEEKAEKVEKEEKAAVAETPAKPQKPEEPTLSFAMRLASANSARSCAVLFFSSSAARRACSSERTTPSNFLS